MSLIEPILTELDQESKATLRILGRVPTEHLAWTPHPKSSSLGRLAFHIASIPAIGLRFARVSVFDPTQARPPQPIPETAEEIVAAYEANVAEARAQLGTMTDEQLQETFTMVRGERTIMSLPKIAMLRTIMLNHSYHHRGQLTVYLRLLDVPLPIIYGSTADEVP